MPYTYPGVYIQELQSPVHAITGVATSITAFVGYTAQGIDNRAQAIFNLGQYTQYFGHVVPDSEVSYAVSQFYQVAPGAQAYVVRVPKAGGAAAVTFAGLTFKALSSGAWANGNLLIDVDQGPPADLTADPTAFNLTVTNLAGGPGEHYPNLTLDASKMNYFATVINDPDNGSQLVSVSGTAPTTPLPVSGFLGSPITQGAVNTALSGGATTGSATATTVDSHNYALALTTSNPAWSGDPLVVVVFGQGTPIPQSMSGLASRVQQAINAALKSRLPGASVQCSVAPVVVTAATTTTPATYGQAIRVSASLPGQPDAVLSFAAPAAGGSYSDAATPLGLVAATGASPPSAPAPNVAHYALGSGNGGASGWGSETATTKVTDGALPGTSALVAGLSALDKVDLFNLLSIPDATRAIAGDPHAPDTSVDAGAIYSQAIAYCDQRRAFLLVDPPPNVATVNGAIDWISETLGITDANGAAFWPRPRVSDPATGNMRTIAPSGVVAGVYAATDASRGVWKAPAGINATLRGVQSLTYQLTNDEIGELNPLGLNCLRSFPVYGRILWGARTLQGADALASQWKYVPVRRLALFLEESLYRGLQWVVFEPNDAPLWGAIRLNVESFMQTLFLKGAFQGTTPDQAYFIKCDSETTTQADIDNGIVNILVGFAPLKPAEFVVIQLEQLAGQGGA
jgi:phage tail sheath protein FI